VVFLWFAAGCAGTAVSDTDKIDALMRDYQGSVPGASVLVVRDGQAMVRKSYGFADLETETAATPETNYRLASVTKQFTAAAIMLLAERGTLSYDDLITRFLPTLPSWANGITLRHLLTHTSGLLDYEDLPADTTAQLLDRDVLGLLERQETTYFPPGTRYRYSNTGYAFLALIVEAASGQPFASFLRHEIFQPLGMRETVAHQQGISQVAHRAYGYSWSNGIFARTDQSRTSAVLGDGGIYSSIDDLLRWVTAMEKRRLLRADTLELAFRPATSTEDPAVRYGFGWRISEHRGRRMLWHSGETIGFRNVLMHFPEDGLSVIVLTNRNEPKPYPIALSIADLFL
jgi:CubicO group peptidase (beta-lactamase class C family)